MTDWQDISTGHLIIESDKSAVVVETIDGKVMAWADWISPPPNQEGGAG